MDVKELAKEYCYRKQVETFEVGEGSMLKLSALFRLCQEASEEHLGIVGLPYQKLKDDGIVFLFTRMWAKINRMPLHREPIEVVTYPKGLVRAQFYRGFTIKSGDEILAEALQGSVAANAETHKILNPKRFLEYGIFTKDGNDRVLDKIVLPDTLESAGERQVYYSDLDYNGHLNNAVYADLIGDFMPGGMPGKTIREVQINYISECRFGDCLKISTAEQSGRIYFFGENERGTSFEAYACLEEEKQ